MALVVAGLVVAACGGPATPSQSLAPLAAAAASASATETSSTPPTSPPVASPTFSSPTSTPNPISTSTPDATPEPTSTPPPAPTAKPAPSQLTLTDKSGDLLDTDTEGRTTGPKYVDVLRLVVNADGSDLFIEFDLAGAPPKSLDALYTTVGYYLLIDLDGDTSWEYDVDLSSLDDWAPTLFDVGASYSYSGDNFPGSATVIGRSVLLRVPLDALGSPSKIRFQGLVQYEDYPDPINDPLTSKTAEDRIPGDGSKWVTITTGL